MTLEEGEGASLARRIGDRTPGPTYWLSLPISAIAAGWLLARHPVLYILVCVAVLFSGYFVSGLLQTKDNRRFYASFFIVTALIVGGCLGFVWSSLFAGGAQVGLSTVPGIKFASRGVAPA